MKRIGQSLLPIGALVVLTCSSAAWAQPGDPRMPESEDIPSSLMTFFVTSEPIGDGGNLGGLAGADAHCQRLATAVGAGDKTWRAYLSTQARPGQPAVDARDRIGDGPWYYPKERILDYLEPKLTRDAEKPVILYTDAYAPYQAVVAVYDVLAVPQYDTHGYKVKNISVPTQSEVAEYIEIFGYNPFEGRCAE